ncbi:hypothetical protein Tco_0674123 [Tanacetum coccineum]
MTGVGRNTNREFTGCDRYSSKKVLWLRSHILQHLISEDSEALRCRKNADKIELNSRTITTRLVLSLNIRVILMYSTMKMEICLEPASKQALGRIHKDGDGDASFQLESDSLPHAHAQTTKTYHKHQDSRIMKAQELKTKTSAQTLIYKVFLQRYQVYQGRLLASFQDDAKYEHDSQDTRLQGGKDNQDGRLKI